VDGAGYIYVADSGDNLIRRITPGGEVTTLAGNDSFTVTTTINTMWMETMYLYEPIPGYSDGTGSAALFNDPAGIAVDGAGNIYVADAANNAVRKGSPSDTLYIAIQPQNQTVHAGEVAWFSVDTSENSTSTFQWQVWSGASSSWVNLADGGGISGSATSSLRVTASTALNDADFQCVVTDGSSSITSSPAMLTVTGPTVMTPFQFTTFSGAGVAGSEDGSSGGAEFRGPNGLAVDAAGDVYVADVGNNLIRMVSPAGVVTTLAGSAGQTGSTDGAGSAALFNQPESVAVDGSGDLYVADSGNDTIRKLVPSLVNGATTWTVSTLAGAARRAGSADGAGGSARFNGPYGVAVDGAGNVYVADSGNDTIRMITPSGAVTTLAGTAGKTGSADGLGSVALLDNPEGVAVDGSGNLYVADTYNDKLRMITPTVAGGSTMWNVATIDAGSPFNVSFGRAAGVAVDSAGNVYVSTLGNSGICEVSPPATGGSTGWEPTYLQAWPWGGEVESSGATGVAVDQAGNLYVSLGGIVAKMTPTTSYGYTVWNSGAFAGTAFAQGSRDGTGALAEFNHPWGIAFDAAGNLFVSDTGNDTIRRVTPSGAVTLVAGSQGNTGTADGPGGKALFYGPQGIAVDNNSNIYVADTQNTTIRRITPDGVVSTLAGSFVPNPVQTYRYPSPSVGGYADGTGSAALFANPQGIGVDGSGNVYVADTGNEVIRKITSGGLVSTLAGAAGQTGGADGAGSAAQFNEPTDVAVDAAGNVYVADTGNSTIRRITPAGAVTTLAGTAGQVGDVDGLGTAARFFHPDCLAVDGAGNVYVTDTGNSTIRRISPAGSVTTLGGGPAAYNGYADGMGSVATFNTPNGVAVDGAGNVYVADTDDDVIRKATPAVSPYIASQPQSQVVNAGSDVTLAVGATGNSPLGYQWLFNGTPIAGAVAPTLALNDVKAANEGSYEVSVSDSSGNATTSASATLGVVPVTATVITGQPTSQTVSSGGTVAFTVNGGESSGLRASGNTAMVYDGTTYQWQFNGVNLQDGFGVSGSQGPQLIIQGATAANSGDYACVVTTAGTSYVSNTAGLNVVSTSNPGSLTALSIRAFVGEGDAILIGGFYITGSTSCTVLVQALGPALAGMNVTGILQHPTLTIHQTQNGQDVVLYSNTGWGSSQVLLNAAAAAGAQPALTPGSADSEILATLPPGGYTAEVTGADGGTGVALCAVYLLP
jgi:hypothetical protein